MSHQLKYLRQLEVRLQNTTLDWVLSSTTELLLPPTVMPAGSQQQTAKILDEPDGKCPMQWFLAVRECHAAYCILIRVSQEAWQNRSFANEVLKPVWLTPYKTSQNPFLLSIVVYRQLCWRLSTLHF